MVLELQLHQNQLQGWLRGPSDPLRVSDSVYWDGARAFAFLTNSLVILMLLVGYLTAGTTALGNSCFRINPEVLRPVYLPGKHAQLLNFFFK